MKDNNDLNEPLRIEMRRYRSLMELSSRCIVAFGIWSIIKFILQIMNDPSYIFNNENGTITLVQKFAEIAMLTVIIALDLFMRLYIANSARKVSKGERKKTGYLFFAFLLILESITGIIICILDMRLDKSKIIQDIVTILVELTAIGAVTGLIFASIRFRKARDTYLLESGRKNID